MTGELDRIMTLIKESGGIEGLEPDDDFYEAGFSSINALTLLMDLETACGVTIPDDRFIASRTPRDLESMIIELKQA